jgi:hypothetical protein
MPIHLDGYWMVYGCHTDRCQCARQQSKAGRMTPAPQGQDSKPGATKSNPGATKSKPGATKSKSSSFHESRFLNRLSPFRRAQALIDSARRPKIPRPEGRAARVHWPTLLSEKLNHRFGHLARKCLPKPSPPPIGAWGSPSHSPRLPFIAGLLGDDVGAWTKMLNVGGSTRCLAPDPKRTRREEDRWNLPAHGCTAF